MTNNSSSNDDNSNGLDSKIVDCPSSINDPALQDKSQWIPYVESHGILGHAGNFLFHGNQKTFLENKEPSLESPQVECTFLVSSGELIGEDHQYSGMGGSANYYSDSLDHTFIDPGGIVERGGEGFATSMEYYYDSASEYVSDEAKYLYKDSWLESAIDYYDSDEADISIDRQFDAVEKNDEEAFLLESIDNESEFFESAFGEPFDSSELSEVAYVEEATDFDSTSSSEVETTNDIFSSPKFETVSFATSSFESSSSYESYSNAESGGLSEADYAREF